jgi:hypothetical protein
MQKCITIIDTIKKPVHFSSKLSIKIRIFVFNEKNEDNINICSYFLTLSLNNIKNNNKKQKKMTDTIFISYNSFCFKIRNKFYKISKRSREEYENIKLVFSLGGNVDDIMPYCLSDISLIINSATIIRKLRNTKVLGVDREIMSKFANWLVNVKTTLEDVDMLCFPYLHYTRFNKVKFNKKRIYGFLHFIKRFRSLQQELRKKGYWYVDPHEMNVIYYRSRFYLIDYDLIVPIVEKLGFSRSLETKVYFGQSSYVPPMICNGLTFATNFTYMKETFLSDFQILLNTIELHKLETEEEAEKLYLLFSSSHLALFCLKNHDLKEERQDHVDCLYILRQFCREHIQFIEGKIDIYPDIFHFFPLDPKRARIYIPENTLKQDVKKKEEKRKGEGEGEGEGEEIDMTIEKIGVY